MADAVEQSEVALQAGDDAEALERMLNEQFDVSFLEEVDLEQVDEELLEGLVEGQQSSALAAVQVEPPEAAQGDAVAGGYMDEDVEADEALPGEEAGAADTVPMAEQQPEEPAPVALVSARDELEARKNERIMASMTEAQLDRYEAFRRSALARPKMKKLLTQLMGANPSDRTVIAMCGIGKMFVGDLIELARYQASAEGHTGPLLPRHIQRAYQMLDAAEKVPHAPGSKRRMFR